MKVGLEFVYHTLIIAELMRVLPKSLCKYVDKQVDIDRILPNIFSLVLWGKFMPNRLNSGQEVFEILEPIVSRRFEERERQKLGFHVPDHVSFIQLFEVEDCC